MSEFNKGFALVLTVVIIFLSGCSKSSESELPEYFHKEFITIKDTKTTLSEYSSKPIFLFFWTADCESCSSDAKTISELYKRNGNSSILLGVNTDKDLDSSSLLEISKKWEINFDSLMDPDYILVQGMKVDTSPALVVVKVKNGKVNISAEYDLGDAGQDSLIDFFEKAIH